MTNESKMNWQVRQYFDKIFQIHAILVSMVTET